MRQWLAFPAGLFTAASLFLRQDQAVYTMVSIVALAIALGIARDHSMSRADLKQALLFWLAGIAIVLIPAIFVWWRLGALPEMFRQLILFPFTTYRKTSALPFPRLFEWRSGLETTLVLLFYLLPLVQAIAAVCLGRSLISRPLRRRQAILAFLIIWSALFYLQVIIRSDIIHLVITLPPFLLLVGFGWSIVREKVGSHRTLYIALCVVSTALVVWVLWMPFALPHLTGKSEQLRLDRGGVRMLPAQAHVVADFVRHVQASVPPDRSILVLPYMPVFYFLCERRNPTHWNYLWPGDQTAHDQERLIEEAERDPPALVLLSQKHEVAAFAPAIIRYLRAHYFWTGNFGDVGTYTRKSEPK